MVETDLNSRGTTTFTAKGQDALLSSQVSVMTVLEFRDSILGRAEDWFTAKLLQPIYEKELELLATIRKG